MTFTIRSATQTDLNDILSLNIREYWDSKKEWLTESVLDRYKKAMWWGDSALLNWHFNIIKKTGGEILLAFQNDLLVGELDYIVSMDNMKGNLIKRGHIIWVLVDKKYRKQGFAKSLISHLSSIHDFEIWVEAEDIRSEMLYRTFTTNIVTIYNSSITKEIKMANNLPNIKINSTPSNNIEYKTSMDKLIDLIGKGIAINLTGRYYAPLFDILQLVNPDPFNIIWGGLPPATLVHFNTTTFKCYGLVTQYPRIYFTGEMNKQEATFIISYMINQVLQFGFESAEFQMYDFDLSSKVFEEINQKLFSDKLYRII